MDLLSRFTHYLSTITKEDKIAVLYHAYCTDGLCSALITVKALERYLGRNVNFKIYYGLYYISEEIIQFFSNNGITKVIFVDLALYSKEEMIKKTEQTVDLLLIDHHEFNHDLNSEHTLFLHASLLHPEIKSYYYPASKLVYDLFSPFVRIDDLDWLACVGLISDSAYLQWKDFVIDVMQKHSFEFKEDIFSTELGKLIGNIGAAQRFNETGEKNVFNIVYHAVSCKEVMNHPLLLDCKRNIEHELEYWVALRGNAQIYGNLIIYFIVPKYDIGARLATFLVSKYFLNKTVVVISGKGDYARVSARDYTTLRVNDLLQKSVREIPFASAGGHVNCAAAKFKLECLHLFTLALTLSYTALKSEELKENS